MICGIDAQILIYAGVVPAKALPADADQAELESLRVRSKMLLHMLAREKAEIILPTIAIAEILVPVPPRDHGALLAELCDRFHCPSFSLQAASIAADLWSGAKLIMHDLGYDKRHVLSADCKIVATAKAMGATEFYSHDGACRNLASRAMKAKDLPENDAGDMFLKGDILSGDV